MTYKEFMQWAEENEELKTIIPKELAEYYNTDDVMERLRYIKIYPNQYTNVPFSNGCYHDALGNWFYFTQIDERTSPTPDGKKLPEEECFENLKIDVLYEIEQKSKKKREEAERIRIANLTPEEKAEREREAKLLRIFHLVMDMFKAENNKAKRLHQVIIDLNKIYGAFDDSDEGNETFKTVKEQYVEQFGEEKGIKLFKIFKFITYFGMAQQHFGLVYKIDSLILQKVNKIFTKMLKKEEGRRKLREERERNASEKKE